MMLTGLGKLLGTLSITLVSDCVAPEPTLTEMAPARAAVTVGSALTVERMLGCALATLVRSAELAMATRHDRGNMVGCESAGRASERARRLVSAFASLFDGEIREPKYEPFWYEVLVPGDLETTDAVRKERERAAGDRLLTANAHFTAQNSTE